MGQNPTKNQKETKKPKNQKKGPSRESNPVHAHAENLWILG